jgi:hypothetical protein
VLKGDKEFSLEFAELQVRSKATCYRNEKNSDMRDSIEMISSGFTSGQDL